MTAESPAPAGPDLWPRTDEADVATDRILDAAARLFEARGVGATSMGDVAREAGCSRATLYRYVANRRELHLAFVGREARRMASRLAAELPTDTDPAVRLRDGVLRAVASVRRTPSLAAWFAPEDAGLAVDVSGRSEVIATMARCFTAELTIDGQPPADADLAERADVVVRAIVSLLTMPGADDRAEARFVERMVVPAVLGR